MAEAPTTAGAGSPTRSAAARRFVRVDEHWWLAPLVIALASRAWGSLLVVAFGSALTRLFVDPPAAGPATLWDGAWFLEVARFGYHAGPIAQGIGGAYYDFSFWPAWPALLGVALRVVPLPTDLTAGLIANGLSIVALVLWAGVLERSFGRSIARYAVALIAFSPSAFILSMAYSEPLFLVIGTLFFLSPAGSLARPLAAVIGQATRLTGFALGATALPELIRSRGRGASAWLTLLGPVLVFGAWWIFVATLTGNASGYLQGSPSWLAGSHAIGGPLSFLIAFKLGSAWLFPIAISALFAMLIVTGTVILVRQRRWEFACYAAVAVVPTLVLASWEWMPRHLLIAVPAAAGLMSALSIRRRRQLVLSLFGAQAIYALLVLGARFAP